MMGIVVVVHEYGHYIVGRWFGAAVESFSIGFGRPAFERTDLKGTRWRVNWIPLGGFVKFVGEAQTAGDVGKIEQGPVGKPYKELNVWQRSLVSLAGPFANFVLAALIFAVLLGVHGRATYKVGIAGVLEDMPAQAAGLEAGDIVLAINGKQIENLEGMSLQIMLNPNTPIDIEIDRSGERLTLVATPIEVVRENDFGQRVAQSTLGVSLRAVEAAERIKYSPVEAIWQGVLETGATVDRTVTMMTRIATGRMSVHSMTGPVGIGDVSRRAVNQIWDQKQLSESERVWRLVWMLMSICGAISVGVGFFNLLPLPILDGGHLVFNLYEAVAGKELPEKVQEVSLTIGLFLLLGMVVVITWGDIIETGLFGSTGS